LGQSRRVDEAFQILESLQDGIATGSPRLSARFIYGLLNAILETGLFMLKTKIIYCHFVSQGVPLLLIQ
jgi:hypothetical protein